MEEVGVPARVVSCGEAQGGPGEPTAVGAGVVCFLVNWGVRYDGAEGRSC